MPPNASCSQESRSSVLKRKRAAAAETPPNARSGRSSCLALDALLAQRRSPSMAHQFFPPSMAGAALRVGSGHPALRSPLRSALRPDGCAALRRRASLPGGSGCHPWHPASILSRPSMAAYIVLFSPLRTDSCTPAAAEVAASRLPPGRQNRRSAEPQKNGHSQTQTTARLEASAPHLPRERPIQIKPHPARTNKPRANQTSQLEARTS